MDYVNHNADLPNEYEVIELLPCTICNRSFNSDVLKRHSIICNKIFKKHKKPFDSSKQRRQGTEMNAYLPRMKKPQDTSNGVEKSKKNWKVKHEQLINTLRAARGEKPEDNLLISISKPIDHKSCPYCERQFGPKSYDRHVDFCREKARRIPATPVTSQFAKERLEARTQYRALAFKPLCTATKDKHPPTTKKSIQNCSSVPIKVVQPLKKITTPIINKSLSNSFHRSSELKKNDPITKSLYGSKNAINLPKKLNNIKETAIKKSESAYSSSSQSQVKQKVSIVYNNNEKNMKNNELKKNVN